MPLNLGDAPDLTNKAIKCMPKVVVKGKVKHFAYSPQGKKEAENAKKMNISGNPLRKRKQKYTVGE